MTMRELIAARAAEANQSDLEYVAGWLADGQSLANLARELKCSRSALSGYALGLDGAAGALREARTAGADALVDEARHVLETTERTREGIAISKALSEMLLWQAGKQSRAEWGEISPTVAIRVDLGSAHLSALRELRARHVPRSLPSETIEDAEILSDD